MRVEVSALGGRGDAIGRLDSGEVVMIAGGVPGDLLEISRSGRRQGVSRGHLRSVIRPSVDRVVPFCPVFERCGGCSWQQVALAAQRRTKHALAARALGDDASKLLAVGEVPGKGWRRRVRLHLRLDASGRLACGMMARGSDALVETEVCPVMLPSLSALLARCRDWLQGKVERAEIHAVEGAEGVIVAVSARPLAQAEAPVVDADTLKSLKIAGILLEFGRHRAHVGLAEVTLTETVGEIPIRVDAMGFCQASEAGNRAIRAEVLKAVDACAPLQRVQEFFAGSGNLGAVLLGRVPAIRCVESNRAAVGRARRSLGEPSVQGTRYQVVGGDAALLASPAGPGELWLLDPGRLGASALCARAAELQPEAIVYVSCAPATLRRDLGTLRAAGYLVDSASWIDAFPHTPHLEMVVRLHRGVSDPQG